jgi:hypothetical protein
MATHKKNRPRREKQMARKPVRSLRKPKKGAPHKKKSRLPTQLSLKPALTTSAARAPSRSRGRGLFVAPATDVPVSVPAVSASTQDSQFPAAATSVSDTPLPDDLDQRDPSHYDSLVAEIKATHRRRQDLLRAETKLTLQIKAIQRRMAQPSQPPAAEDSSLERNVTADETSESPVDSAEDVALLPAVAAKDDPLLYFATFPFVQSRAVLKKHRLVAERRCRTLAMRHPLYAAFVEPIFGMAALGLAQLLGEAGEFTRYLTVAKLWKRMGVAVINGERQRRVTGEAALLHGYAPERRAILWNIGDALIKKANRYREVYLARKVYELESAQKAGLTVLPQAVLSRKPKGEMHLYRSQGHVHNRAKRYTEKRLLRDIWSAARKLEHPPKQSQDAPSS